jgi:hypothetical protein
VSLFHVVRHPRIGQLYAVQVDNAGDVTLTPFQEPPADLSLDDSIDEAAR